MFAVRSILRVALSGFAVLLLVAGSGCGSAGGAAGPGGRIASGVGGGGSNPGRAPEAFATLDQGSQSGYPAQGSLQLVIRDDPTWQGFWARHKGGSAPPVDFARDQVLAALAGQKPTGGYGVEFRSIERIAGADALEARVFESVPDPNQPVTMALTSPYHVVRVARNAGPVSFVVERELGLETLAKGANSGDRYGDPTFAGEVRVVQDAAAWAALWADHTSNVSPPPPLPAVDFATSMVVAAYQGFRTSSGYSVTVREVAIEEASRELLVTLEIDERGGPLTVITNPYHFVRAVPRLVPSAVRIREARVLAPVDVERGAISGYRYGDPAFTGDRLVFTGDASWQAFWAQHTANVFPPPPAPAIDFARESVLVALMGYRPTGGYGIEIERVVRLPSGAIEATVRETSPAQGSIVTQVVTNPIHAVRVPVAGARATFR